MDVHLNAAVSGGLTEDFLPCENTEGGDGVSLEWLSVFVEDCLNGGFTTQPLLPTTTTTTTTTDQSPRSPQAQAHSQQQQGGPTQKALSSVSVSVPSKARTKRRKTNPQTTTTTTTTNSLHTFHVSYSDSPPLLPQAYWLADSELLIRPKKEAQTDRPLEEGEGEEAVAVAVKSSSEEGQLGPRRCTHCLSYKTPQWRAGPLGPKTLCNACGVRFKSGRLLPEYRPAKSPTFESFKHSNSHKKVMEMRMMATILSSHTN